MTASDQVLKAAPPPPRPVFETILRDAKDYTRHLLDAVCEEEDVTSPRGRGAVAQRMAQVIAKIPNAVQRESFLLEVARRLPLRNVDTTLVTRRDDAERWQELSPHATLALPHSSAPKKTSSISRAPDGNREMSGVAASRSR